MEILEDTRQQLLKDLNTWISRNYLDVKTITDDVYEIEGVGKFLLVNPKSLTPNEENKNEVVLQDYRLLLDQFEQQLSQDKEISYLLFQFGTKFYYCESEEPEFQLFKYLGKAKLDFQQDYPYLGIHGGYELGSGSRLYKDWCKKAKFLGISTLGVCEEGTLAGVVNFQYTCKKAGIKPIIGETLFVEDSTGTIYTVKLFPMNEQGFTNLTILNNRSNRSPNKTISFEDFIKYQENQFIVLHTDTYLDSKLFFNLKSIKERLFYQIDFREWGSDERDLQHLNNLKNYLHNYKDKISPILLTDSYYLDEEDAVVRKYLMKISDIGFKPQSDKLYFKSLDEIYEESLPLFKDEDTELLQDIIEEGIESCRKLGEEINFEVKSKGFLLPEYEMTEEEKKKFKTNEDLFFHLIEKGVEEKVINKGKDIDVYMDRLEKEINVLQRGGFIDYFLILWDAYRYCSENGILVGLGRGSAAGAATAWILGVTGLDPIEYKLLFERFLNEARIHLSPPDVDCDFMANRRDEVKEYVRQKYGYKYVTGIAAYTTLKLKAALKALNRQFGVDPKTSNYISAIIGDELHHDVSLAELGRLDIVFKTANKVKQVKEFIQPRRKLIELLPLLLNQTGNSTVHAAGLIILPKKNKEGKEWDIEDGLPTKQMDGIEISEWEGKYLDDLGYIKYDFLGLSQLDKFRRCFDLIQEHYGIELKYEDIDLQDEKTFRMFREGKTEDVFQFSGGGLAGYVKELGPTELNDLIATAAIYRPGPIEIGVHKSFIERKNGREEVVYELGTEEITRDTYGLWVYQEQIMQACTKIAGFTTAQSDGVRKCLHGDSLMWTTEGYFKIKDLVKNRTTRLLTYNDKEMKNKMSRFDSIFYSGKKKTIKVITKSGRELICTPDHRVYTSIGWVDAKDSVGLDLLHEVVEKYGTYEEDLNKLLLIVGLITEGHYNHFSNKDLREIHNFKQWYKDFFKEPAPYEKLNTKDGEVYEIYVKEEFFRRLDIEKELSGSKKLPDYFLRLSKELLLPVIGKLIDFDGSIYSNGYITYCTKSKELATQVSVIFEMTGVGCYIQKSWDEKYSCFYYEVYICDRTDCIKLINYILPYSYKAQSFDINILLKKSESYSKYKVPQNIWYPIISSLVKNSGYTAYELFKSSFTITDKVPLTLPRLKNILDICGKSKLLDFYLKRETYWDEVASIEDYGEVDVYDFTMGWGCSPQGYVNGLLVHNSIGKMLPEELQKYGDEFVEGAVNNGHNREEAVSLWDKFKVFGSYAFNLSHSACYATMGYYSQWLKVNYPLEFWTTSLEFSDDKQIPSKIVEINEGGSIRVVPVDINKSKFQFVPDKEKNVIYWSLSSIKWVGDSSVEHIIQERETSQGDYFSLEEFCDRVEKKKVNKRGVIHLILAGAFDEIESIQSPADRFRLIEQFMLEIRGERVLDINQEEMRYWKDHHFTIKQKELTGIGEIDYRRVIIEESSLFKTKISKYLPVDQLEYDGLRGKDRLVCGLIHEVIVRNSKRGEFCQVALESNSYICYITIWNDVFEKHREELVKGRLLLFMGEVEWDSYKKKNVLKSTHNTQLEIL